MSLLHEPAGVISLVLPQTETNLPMSKIAKGAQVSADKPKEKHRVRHSCYYEFLNIKLCESGAN